MGNCFSGPTGAGDFDDMQKNVAATNISMSSNNGGGVIVVGGAAAQAGNNHRKNRYGHDPTGGSFRSNNGTSTASQMSGGRGAHQHQMHANDVVQNFSFSKYWSDSPFLLCITIL